MIPIAWLGLWLSLNQTARPTSLFVRPSLAVEATAIVGVGKLTVTVIAVRPLSRYEPALVSVGVGVRVF